MYWHAQAFLIWFWMFRIRIPCDRGKRPSNKTQKSNEKGWPRFDILCILNACHVSPIKSRTLGVGRCQKATFQLLLYSLEQENRLFCSSLSMSLRQTLSFSLPFAWVAKIIVLPSSLVNITLEKTFPIITKPQVSLVVLRMQRLHILVKSCRINTGSLFSLQTFSLIKIEARCRLFILHSKIRKLRTLNNLPRFWSKSSPAL